MGRAVSASAPALPPALAAVVVAVVVPLVGADDDDDRLRVDLIVNDAVLHLLGTADLKPRSRGEAIELLRRIILADLITNPRYNYTLFSYLILIELIKISS